MYLYRSSHKTCSIKKAFLEIFAIFTGKSLCWSLFFNKVVALKTCNFIKEETSTQVFACEYCEIFKNSVFIEHLRWLLLWGIIIIVGNYYHSGHSGINPPSNPSPPLSCQAPLKLANCPSLPFLGNPPPLYWFVVSPHPKSQVFQ